jgi:hypothetical protein
LWIAEVDGLICLATSHLRTDTTRVLSAALGRWIDAAGLRRIDYHWNTEITAMGRPRGAKNKHTLERETLARWGVEAANRTGRSPLQVVLAVMDGDRSISARQFAAATAALPFCHPRLSAVAITDRDPIVDPELEDRRRRTREYLMRRLQHMAKAEPLVIDADEPQGEIIPVHEWPR